MRSKLFIIILCVGQISLFGQFRHYDFIGAGHSNEVVVTTSSSTENNSGDRTIDGFDISNEEQLKDASRFLAQCTFGADMATIQMTAAMGYESWLDEQFELPVIQLTPVMEQFSTLEENEEEEEEEEAELIFYTYMEQAWMHNNLSAPDLLRQRLAFIWSQIMVINTNSDLFEDVGHLSSTYYDMLSQNTFKNYRNLINDVTYHPAMGLFLSHYNNPKADPENNIHPDENYAREIMQLFSIGLWELDQYGNRKYDNEGQFIPTYSNADIKEFAQVFTGLGDGSDDGQFGAFGDIEFSDIGILPMKMYEDFHDSSEKHLLNGYIIPANQSGDEDIRLTLDHLSAHPNTAPFIVRSLIRFLTTSNPSGAYVERVASVFDPFAENNFKDVLRAILLDPEARNCNPTTAYSFGKLREPFLRRMNYLKAFPMDVNPSGHFGSETKCIGTIVGQSPLSAPSVFNFFLPEYSPQGPINQQYLVAPEFQILNSTNSIGLVNDVNLMAVERNYLGACFDLDDEEEVEGYSSNQLAYTAEEEIAMNSDLLLQRLDILLANGLLSTETKTIIKSAIDQLEEPEDRIKMALYLIMISPDYAILK